MNNQHKKPRVSLDFYLWLALFLGINVVAGTVTDDQAIIWATTSISLCGVGLLVYLLWRGEFFDYDDED